MAVRPGIGIATCAMLADYVAAVREAGGEPVIIEGETPAEAVTATIDGLVLTGGGDVDPARYGEPRHATVAGVDARRDAIEIALVRHAIAADRPLLAICRGLQVLNVAEGGSLVQDIPSAMPGALNHSVRLPRAGTAHPITVSAGSRLHAVLESHLSEGRTCGVNSRHHQAAARIAAGFDVSARSSDGIIEAIERPASRFCLAVQWHPENFWRTGEFQPLFAVLVASARERRPL